MGSSEVFIHNVWRWWRSACAVFEGARNQEARAARKRDGPPPVYNEGVLEYRQGFPSSLRYKKKS